MEPVAWLLILAAVVGYGAWTRLRYPHRYCPKCAGKGELPNGSGRFAVCKKCEGSGKLMRN